VRGIKQIFKRMLFNYRNKDNKVKLHSDVIFNGNTFLEGNNVIYSSSQINDSNVGFGTYISNNCRLPNSIIGRYCCIGSNVKIVFGQHPIKKFVSIHPAFYSTKLQAGFTYVDENKFEEHKFVDNNSKKTITIGNDVWIGQDVLILEGVKIADGSVIGAGAIVTKDTQPFSISVGIPAKIVGYRFEEHQRQVLMSLEWWNKDQKWIEKNKRLFEDVGSFYEKFTNIKDKIK
jgi:acetyltransferase-like isoleucine patch superfamily enzyme